MAISSGLRELFKLSMSFVEKIGDVWDWLTSSQEIGFRVPIIGFVGYEWVPLPWILGGGFLVALGFAIVKLLPLA